MYHEAWCESKKERYKKSGTLFLKYFRYGNNLVNLKAVTYKPPMRREQVNRILNLANVRPFEVFALEFD